jgi:hypothetical protein
VARVGYLVDDGLQDHGANFTEARIVAGWITRETPDLRIVLEPLWRAAHARLAVTRTLYARRRDGRLIGRPEGSLESRYLLSGFVTAESAGGA